MKHVKLLVIPGVLIALLAALMLGVSSIQTSAHAAIPSKCGAWSVVKSPSVGKNSAFNAVVAVSENDVWAAGYGNSFNPMIEHWNGTNWQVVPTPDQKVGGTLNGLAAISTNDVWAVGRDYSGQNGKGIAMHWNGTKWSLIPTPNPGAGSLLASVTAISTTNVWAVGSVDITTNASEYLTLVEHWNGKSWQTVDSPSSNNYADALSSVSVVSANNIWAVGSTYNGNTQSEIEHWDGTKWSMVTPPASGTNTALNGVAAISAKNVWATGFSDNNTLIEHFDGTAWSVVASPSIGTASNSLSSLAVVSANNIWAVGGYYNSKNVVQTLIEHWNGSKWSIVKSPNVGSSGNGLSGSTRVPATSHIWAVGAYGPSFTQQKTLAEYYC